MATAHDTPGWRPDPQRPGTLRWWNGLGWSDARKAATDTGPGGFGVRPAADGATGLADAAQEAARQGAVTPGSVGRAAQRLGRNALPTASGGPVPLAAGVAGGAAATNALAGAALVLGIMGVVVGGLGVLPLAGLVVSLLALARSRRLASTGARRTGLGRSLAGLLLSVVGLLRWVPVAIEVLGRFLQD